MKCFGQHPAGSGPKVIPLVTVMVMAEDAHGAPVLDLQSSDFHIFDDDHEAKIVSLHVTNSRGPHNTIIFLDQLNMGVSARGRNASALLAFLRKQTPDQMSHVYLYILNREGALVPVRSLADSAGVQPAAVISLFKQVVGQVQRLPSVLQFDWGRRYDVTALALENLVPPLIGARGVKDIVWITGGISIVNYRAEAPKLAASMNQVNAPVYVAFDLQHEWVVEEDGSNINPFQTWELLKRLTQLTGGRVAFDVNDTLRKAQSDLRTAYELIYAPAPDSWDNTDHTIRLECTQPGINLRYKQIYFARKQ